MEQKKINTAESQEYQAHVLLHRGQNQKSRRHTMIYEIIDTRTGERAKAYELVQEPWAGNTRGCDWPAFAIDEDGDVMLTDDCGNYDMVPEGRVEVRLVVDRKMWKPCSECDRELYLCSNCAYEDAPGLEPPCLNCDRANYLWKPKYEYCPRCGYPLTAAAWAELEKKIRGCVE